MRYSMRQKPDKQYSDGVLFIVFILFTVTGVLSPLLVEVVKLNGGATRSTNLIAIPACLGQTFCIFTNFKRRNVGTIRWRWVSFMAFADGLAQLLLTNGLLSAGPSIFTVVYSSITVYTAIFAYCILQRKLHNLQYIGVMIVVVGLGIASDSAEKEGGDLLAGIVLISVGTLIHATMYVISEYLLIQVDDPIPSELLGTLLGTIGLTTNTLWQIFYTIPRWDKLVTSQITLHNGDTNTVLLSYFALTVSGLIHSVCFFMLLKHVGSTSTGMMKCVQSICLFIASHFAFCSMQASDCFTPSKAMSLIFVLSGVMLYSIGFPSSGSHDHSYIPIKDREDGEERL